MRTIRIDIQPITSRLGSLLLAALLLALTAVPAAAQDVPTDGLLLRLQDDVLETSSEFAALEAELDRPTPYTAAAIHPHNGRWSVTISQGTLEESTAPSRFLNDGAAEFFFYDRVLDEDERDALRGYMAVNYRASNAEGSDRLKQGIHVQGSWSIDVRDPDGSLVERRDFENTLASGGANLLAELVVGEFSSGQMNIMLLGDPAPCVDNGSESSCLLIEEGQSPEAGYEFATLTKDVPESGDNEDAIVLRGSFVAQQDGDVGSVQSRVYPCVRDTAPADCVAENILAIFTATGVGFIEVSANQQVNVEVVISFN